MSQATLISWLLFAGHVLLVLLAAVLISTNRKPSAAIAWILAVIFIPVLGILSSSNLDIRSLSLHMELSVLVQGAGFASAMRAVEDDYRAKSRQLMLADWLRRPRRERVFDNLMRLTSSLQ